MWGTRRRKPDGLYFVGTTSPTGAYELVVAGAAALVAEARGAAEKVVIDTCGRACGAAGRELHHVTIDAIRPDATVAIQRGDELSELIGPFEAADRPLVLHATPPEKAQARSRATRRSYRRAKFCDYFRAARELA